MRGIREAMMELREEYQHQRSLVHSRSGTNLLIRGFKIRYADETQNSDLPRNHAGHPRGRMVCGG